MGSRHSQHGTPSQGMGCSAQTTGAPSPNTNSQASRALYDPALAAVGHASQPHALSLHTCSLPDTSSLHLSLYVAFRQLSKDVRFMHARTRTHVLPPAEEQTKGDNNRCARRGMRLAYGLSTRCSAAMAARAQRIHHFALFGQRFTNCRGARCASCSMVCLPRACIGAVWAS